MLKFFMHDNREIVRRKGHAPGRARTCDRLLAGGPSAPETFRGVSRSSHRKKWVKWAEFIKPAGRQFP
jgi:hypothetical protein